VIFLVHQPVLKVKVLVMHRENMDKLQMKSQATRCHFPHSPAQHQTTGFLFFIKKGFGRD
jgi:hypothetical protein